MTPLDVKAGQIQAGAKMLSDNLDFVPADKFDWKPAPTAKSAAEIINHLGRNLTGATASLKTGQWDPNYQPVETPEAAQQMLTAQAALLADVVRALTPSQLEETIALPPGPIPKSFIVDIAVTELLHHNGQVAYLQTIWGDNEDHLTF